jgi:hypothetical protein
MEDHDMFTMFRWSSNVLDDEEIIEKHRGEYEKTRRRDSMKKRTRITAKDIFGGMNDGVEEGLQPPRTPRRLGSFSKTDVPRIGHETTARVSYHSIFA